MEVQREVQAYTQLSITIITIYDSNKGKKESSKRKGET